MYLVLKLIHVVAIIAFLGNISTGLYWKAIADRTRDVHVITHTLAGIIRSDRWFTIPSIVVIVLSGVATALVGHIPVLGTGWILWSIVLFAASGAAFGPVARAQRDMLDLAREAAAGELDWGRYRELTRKWELWGTIALGMPLLAVVLMVLKPALPSLHQ